MKAGSRIQVGVGVLVCLLLPAGAARAGIEVEPYLQDPRSDDKAFDAFSLVRAAPK